MSDAVPESLRGLWRRVWLRAPGVEDRTTEVLWRQGPTIFVDLRTPADLPDLSGAAALADLDAAALTALARCEGFAGTTAVTGEVCVWTRAINWRGPLDGEDAGRLEATPEGLVETGVHADYAELWTHEDAAPGLALKLADDTGRLGFLVATEDAFSLGWGDPAAKRGAPLAERLARRDADALDQEFSVGVIGGGAARVTRSANPLRVCDPPFDPDDLRGEVVTITDRDFHGRPRSRRWRIVSREEFA
ncbi:hypothetical protein [Rubrimonas cliftonensis]|uniref:Uncharacterized protein n=1 Tax=Rubrimonas cliftonensis TaxID=89524 RepID=A0A1H4AHR4_9RHOB|nr:hypothetical protein [Rubrimonas cliftonensis]SEA35134.1 hypothetical protein SAMN05444370_104223 [Rubrimonas cliftonensis]